MYFRSIKLMLLDHLKTLNIADYTRGFFATFDDVHPSQLRYLLRNDLSKLNQI